MLITKDRKRIDSKELFPTIDSFIVELKLNYNSLNFQIIDFQSKILEVYEKMNTSNEIVQYGRLSRWFPSAFNFKFKNRNQIGFWLERGFNKDYFNKLTLEITENRTKKSVVTYQKLKDEKQIIEEGYSKNYKYKNLEFISEFIPKCNTCNSELNMSKFVSDKLGNSIEILNCKNEKCETNVVGNTMNKKLLWYSFLPEYKYQEVLNNIKKDTIFTKQYWISKGLTNDEAILKISEIQTINSKLSLLSEVHKNKGKFKENLRNKGYTEEEIIECCLTPANDKFWLNKGFSKKKVKRKVFKNQSYAAKHVDFKKRLLPSNIQYWIDKGFNEEDAKQNVKNSQTTFSKQICIEKYGEERGLEIFTKRQETWNNSLTKNGNLKFGYSAISQELFNEISSRINGKFKYATKDGEFKLSKNNDEGGIWIYDFVDINRKKIIEYNGDMYHANPQKYKENDNPHPFRKQISSSEIWLKDERKLQAAKENGFEVLIIWDSEFRRKTKDTKELIIKKCINFINNN
jgi:hypothetical protein